MDDHTFETLDKLRTILDVSQRLLSTTDESELLDIVAQSFCRDLGYDACVIFVRESDNFLHARHVTSAGHRPPLDLPLGYRISYSTYEKLLCKAQSIGGIFFIDGSGDTLKDPDLAQYNLLMHPLGDTSSQAPARSLLVAPLFSFSGEVIAMITPNALRDSTSISPGDGIIVDTFSHLTSVAIELARARTDTAAKFRILEAQRQQVTRLFAASTKVKRERQLDKMLGNFVRSMAEAGSFDRVAIYLTDQATSKLVIRATHGFSPEEHEHLVRNELDLSRLAPMMQPEMKISRSYLYDHSKFEVPAELLASMYTMPNSDTWKPGMWHSKDSLIIPLVDDTAQLLGIITVDDPTDGRFPEAYHVQALEFFADQCAIAVSQVVKYRHLEVMAETDSLTKLPNRNAFDLRLQSEIKLAISNNQSISLLFIDLDHFKLVNDTFGHLEGDAILKAVTKRLKSVLRKVDILARFGGEEFVLLLRDTPLAESLTIAEKLRFASQRLPFMTSSGQQAKITLSIGISSLTSEELQVGNSADTVATNLIERADNALYQAKHLGRDQVCQFET